MISGRYTERRRVRNCSTPELAFSRQVFADQLSVTIVSGGSGLYCTIKFMSKVVRMLSGGPLKSATQGKSTLAHYPSSINSVDNPAQLLLPVQSS